MLAGSVDHGDSLGNQGNMGAGDVQWMTAGSGILHQEMPKGDAQGRMHGFQLWANLPSSLKMTAPRYQDIPANAIPEVTDDDGTRVRVICGEFWGKRGRWKASRPIRATSTSRCRPAAKRSGSKPPRNAFAYVFAGAGTFRDSSDPQAGPNRSAWATRVRPTNGDAEDRSLVLFDTGSEVTVRAGDEGDPVPAGLGQADRGAGGVVRPDRDEHTGGTADGGDRVAGRDLHQAPLTRQSRLVPYKAVRRY